MPLDIVYGAWTNFSFDLTSPASDTNLLAGRQSLVVSNAVNKYSDYMVGGTITGPVSGSSGVIQIFAYGDAFSDTDYTGDITGVDGDLALAQEIKDLLVPLISIVTNTNASEIYKWGPISLAARPKFGGIMPARFGLWGVHSAGAALQSITTAYRGVKWENV